MDKKRNVDSILFGIVSLLAVIACVAGMVYCCITFAVNTNAFSKEAADILIEIESKMPEDKEAAESMIKHMESMVAIQKSGMTNDLMSFVYGILSAILVGLCAGFVLKSRNNADESKKTVDEAKKSAELAKSHAVEAEQKSRDTKGIIEEAIKQAQNAAKEANEYKYQARLIILINRVVASKAVIASHDQVMANREILLTCKEIVSLFSDPDFINCKKVFGKTETEQVYDELVSLGDRVNDFWDNCQKKYTGATLHSKEQSASNYHKWINEAIACINIASKKARAESISQ